MQNNHIIMPSDIPPEHSFNALSTLMHEAAHINYTKNDVPRDVVKDSLAHEIFNAIEDIRIDQKNMSMLWNIGEFYRRAVPYDVERRKPLLPKCPLHKKVLINAIYALEGLPEGHIQDKEAEELEQKEGIQSIMRDAIYSIEAKDWDKLRAHIENLIVKLGLSKFPRNPIKEITIGGIGQGKGQGTPCPACGGTGKVGGNEQGDKGKGAGSSQGQPEAGKQGGTCPVCGGSGQADCDLSGLKGNDGQLGHGQGTGSGAGNSELGEVAMREITKQKFKELLNIKETKRIEDMTRINPDNLTAFFTGDINELFCDDVVVKKKKSRIHLLLDGSGSMGCGLPIDGSSRRGVVGGCVKQLASILNEVCELEGLNVDWSIAGFTGRYHPMSKENWEKEYARINGGTDLISAFKRAQDEILSNPEVDGQKLIVVFTDGEVNDSEIEEMHKRIIQHGADVRCMVIGVGAGVTSYFVDEIVHDFNIIAKESADQILLEAIMEMM